MYAYTVQCDTRTCKTTPTPSAFPAACSVFGLCPPARYRRWSRPLPTALATMPSDLATARAAQVAAAEAYRADPFSGSARARAAKADRELKAAELEARTDENVPPNSPSGNRQGDTEPLSDVHAAKAGPASTGQDEGDHKEAQHGPVQEKFRLFVTGWPPSVGSDAMVNKLRSFGRVLDDVVVSRRKPLGGGDSSDGEPFAHLTLETDHNKMTKCMKALNGSMWMDRKLRIERANEHYTDRIKRETQEAGMPIVAKSAGGLAAYQAPITRLRIADPHLPRRRRKRSQVIVELDTSNVPNKIRFNDAGEPIATAAGMREPNRSLADEAKAAADAPAPDSDDETQESSAAAQEPVDVSTDAGIRRMLIEQGFIDSSDEEDVGPAPSATGMTARGEAAEEDGVDIAKEARELLPPDLRADGFNNTAYNLNVDLKRVDAYSKLAGLIVERVDVDKFSGRFSKSRRLIDDDNRDLISKMGRWVLRGPLDEAEIVSYRGIATTVASSGGDFTEAMSYILEAMLQSPRFVYRIESQRGGGSSWPASQHELASRISYILWGSPPDEELLKAADEGRLDLKATAAQADRMLKDPRAKQRSRQFVSQWLNLGRLSNMQPGKEHYPQWDPNLAGDMRDETLAFFDEIVWTQNRPLSELLNAQVTFVTPRLARHYGLKPQDGAADQPARYDLKSTPGRGGLLTHCSVLTVGGDEASMVTRGLFVMQDLLRGVVKDPPPCVDTTPVPTKAGLTQRSIAEARLRNVSCGGCHVKFEPLAFGLEKFDGLGSFHEKDHHGNPLRDDGQILIPGEAHSVSYKSSAELMDLLADSDRVRQTLTWKVAQFAMGRPLVATDAPILAKIHDAAWKAGGNYSGLIKAIVTSDLVQTTRSEQDE